MASEQEGLKRSTLNLVGATRFERATSSTPWRKSAVESQHFESMAVSAGLLLAQPTERLLRDHLSAARKLSQALKRMQPLIKVWAMLS